MRAERSRRQRRSLRSGRGGTAVEFAVILPLFVSLLFGIVEFAGAYSQKVDIRHGASEAGRLAAVDYDPYDQGGALQTATIFAAACARMDDNSTAEIRLGLEATDHADVGDIAVVEVRRDYDAMTPFVSISRTLHTQIDVRLERHADWSAAEGWIACNP